MNIAIKSLLTATALITLPSMAQAAVVATAVNIAVPATTAGVYVNLVTGVNSSSPTSVPGWDINVFSSTFVSFFNPSSPTGGVYVISAPGVVASLAAGTVIGAGSAYGSGNNPAFLTGGDYVFGFRFLNESTAAINYGYARITTSTSSNGRPATITQLVYENTGASLTVAGNATSAVPEPATWAMMLVGFGAIGFAARRRTATKASVRFA